MRSANRVSGSPIMATFAFYVHLREFLIKGEIPENPAYRRKVRRACTNFIIKDDRLFYVGPSNQYMRLVVLSEEEKRSVLTKCHNNPDTGNHSGIRGTQDRVTAGYYWPTIIQDVKDWVRSCHQCQMNEPVKSGDLHSVKLWSAIAMEIFRKETERTVGTERRREDEWEEARDSSTEEETRCPATRSGLKPEPEEVVLGGSGGSECCLCVAFLQYPTQDDLGCHLCQAKSPDRKALILHLKSAHPDYYRSCKRCMDTPEIKPEVEEVIIKIEEVEIQCVKEEEEEVLVRRTEETEENGIAENNNDTIAGQMHDHTYFSTPTFKDTPNNAVLYTSNDNVVVVVNKSDDGTSLTHTRAENDGENVCRDTHDHNYFSSQSRASHMLLGDARTEHIRATDAATDTYPESNLDELCTSSQDHTYCSGHTFPVEQEPPPSSSGHKDPHHRSKSTMTDYQMTSQPELNIKVEDEPEDLNARGDSVRIGNEPGSEKNDHICHSTRDSANAKQGPLGSFHPVNSDGAPQDQALSFPCSQCKIVFGTNEMLVNHKAQKHPRAKDMCAACREPFPNEKTHTKHTCSMSEGFIGESETLDRNGSALPIPHPESPRADAESPEQVVTQRVDVNRPRNVAKVSSSSSPIPETRRVKRHAMTTRSSSARENNAKDLNRRREQITTPISTLTQKQIVQILVSNLLQGKGVTRIPNSAVAQIEDKLIQDLTIQRSNVVSSTLTGNAESMPSVALPLQPQHHPFSSTSNPGQSTRRLPEYTVPFLDLSRSPLSPDLFPSSPGPLKIAAMFANQSKELALQRRMRQTWRSKAVLPCRQCGAVSRQFSLGVRHRYQHRGPRPHRCQCGRAFQQRMHLLRHQVQHAEATRYICAACGRVFRGTQRLACHRRLPRVRSNKRAKRKCRNVFRCHCGRSFSRPAALLWHMLKNLDANKARLKGFRIT